MARLAHRIDRGLLATHGIEGVPGETLNLSDVEMLARAFGSFLAKSGSRQVAVCFDGTPASPELAAAAMSGLLRSGIEVYRLGAGPLPLLKFASETLGCGAGLLVAANGLRPERTAIKLFQDGTPLSPRKVRAFAVMAEEGDLLHKRGRLLERPMMGEYIESLLALWRGGAAGLRVVWDHRNGATSAIVEGIARRFAGDHLLLQQLDPPVGEGDSPAVRLADAVLRENCDLGFSFDSLGERMIALDRRAQPIPASRVAEAMRLRERMDMTDPLQLAVLICGSHAVSQEGGINRAAVGLTA